MPAKAFLALGATVAAVIAVAVAVALLAARDEATVAAAAAPGVARSANADPTVRAGNVVLRYGDERLTRALRTFALATGGAPSAALEAAGQAVVLQRRPDQPAAVVALSATHRLESAGPDDPALRAFVEHWLGRRP